MRAAALLLLAIGPALLGAEEAKADRALLLKQRISGQVGKSFDLRVKSTDKAYNYKLRATWMTPDAIRACARLEQGRRGLSGAEVEKAVADAEAAGGTVVLVELDPREGSGIVPSSWYATFGPAGSAGVRGESRPKLRDNPALAGVGPRDYAYELFWVVFPVEFHESDVEAELTVNIDGRAGRVRWPVPDSLRKRPSNAAGLTGEWPLGWDRNVAPCMNDLLLIEP